MASSQVNSKETIVNKLGIMGGTFDPIHNGHLTVAGLIQTKFALDKVIFVPSHCPPHKSLSEIAPVEHRYAMVRLAIDAYPYFEASRIEIDRDCPTFAGDTIEAFKRMYGRDCGIYFITGLDALLNIVNWERARTYPGICQLIAAARPGYNEATIEARIPPDFKPYISIIEEPSLALSSTDIRRKIRAGEPIDSMVPAAVRDYILKWGLYR